MESKYTKVKVGNMPAFKQGVFKSCNTDKAAKKDEFSTVGIKGISKKLGAGQKND